MKMSNEQQIIKELVDHVDIIKEMMKCGDILFRHPMSKITLELRNDQLLAKARGGK